MAKNIVICCDGTGNQIQENLSNVLKLFRIVVKSSDQHVYYNAGIGTIGSSDAWAKIRQSVKSFFELATGYGLDAEILGAYEFLCRRYQDGDSIFLFGFSRGAYTVRALAGMIRMIGLLPPDQLNIAAYALRAYKQSSDESDFSIAWQFARVSGAKSVPIKFVGVWDTVASVLVPRGDRIIPQLLMLPYTRTNPNVEVFRQAMAIDERRRMFRLNRWADPQTFVANPFSKSAPLPQQNVKQVWFAGVHADIGGGYPESESGLSKFPLLWMVREAVSFGLKTNVAMTNHLALGRSRIGAKTAYVKPDASAQMHDSLTAGWQILEWIPKSAKWMEGPRSVLAGFYLPRGEPRKIKDGDIKPRIHQSVLDRIRLTNYSPKNLPPAYDTEP